MKLGVIFGGNSTEHDVSIISACSIINALNKDKYDIYPIYLDKTNQFYLVNESLEDISLDDIGYIPKDIRKIANPFKYLKQLDCIFPVIHGKSGEDGSIQGLCEILGVPYVGCGILTSSICMNKNITKEFVKDIIDVVPSIHLKKDNNITIKKINKMIYSSFSYPVFVKPCSMGSSVGVFKVLNETQLENAINKAFIFDCEILIEKYIDGRELECAIFDGKSTSVGEVISSSEYYSYKAKYQDKNSKTETYAKIDKEVIKKIKEASEVLFKYLEGRGLARVDFFLENGTNKLYLNEINTMPGFTDISMYPKLVMKYYSITYTEFLDKLIETVFK